MGICCDCEKKGLVFIEKPIQHFKREHVAAGYKLKDLLGIIYRNCKAMIEIKKIKNNL